MTTTARQSSFNSSNKIILCAIFFLLPAIAGFLSLSAQTVGINTTGATPHASAMLDVDAANKGLLVPRVNLTGALDAVTVPSPATSLLVYNKATAGVSPDNVVPGYYYWTGTKWTALSSPSVPARSVIAFSTGPVLFGATVVSSAPVLMGFGNYTTQIINGMGESTMPPEAGGFSFPVPFSGTIQNLQISADLLVASVTTINIIPLQYEFTVFVSPSAPNNGSQHLSAPYITTPLSTLVSFGFPNPVIPGNFYSASNLNTGAITVNAGDRIGIRVRTRQSSDPSAGDITQLSFNASLSYTPAE